MVCFAIAQGDPFMEGCVGKMLHADVIVVGSGIAGASVAALLAATRSVILLEGEPRPGYHSTGRSAALFSEIYGNVVIRALSRASREFLHRPPQGFCESPLLKTRGSLFIATAAQGPALEEFAALPDVASQARPLSAAAAHALCPALREDYVAGAVLEPSSADIDVHGLHDGYLRECRRRGGRVVCDAPVHALEFAAPNWTVAAAGMTFSAPIVVNAAGAWADDLARRAGLEPLGLVPMRRTAMLMDIPEGSGAAAWPMVIDIDEQFYFKPDAGSLLLSPADETPTSPGDVQPEEWDVAVAVDRIQTATTLDIRTLKRRWAGLRTFAPDRTPVAGFSNAAPGFFWLAGQGGYGIQTAPALSSAAAALILGKGLPDELTQLGVRESDLSPSRFARDRQ
jgi:D-arginine dehydrogenase